VQEHPQSSTRNGTILCFTFLTIDHVWPSYVTAYWVRTHVHSMTSSSALQAVFKHEGGNQPSVDGGSYENERNHMSILVRHPLLCCARHSTTPSVGLHLKMQSHSMWETNRMNHACHLRRSFSSTVTFWNIKYNCFPDTGWNPRL